MSKSTVMVALRRALAASYDKSAIPEKYVCLRDQVTTLLSMMEHEEKLDAESKR